MGHIRRGVGQAQGSSSLVSIKHATSASAVGLIDEANALDEVSIISFARLVLRRY